MDALACTAPYLGKLYRRHVADMAGIESCELRQRVLRHVSHQCTDCFTWGLDWLDARNMLKAEHPGVDPDQSDDDDDDSGSDDPDGTDIHGEPVALTIE